MRRALALALLLVGCDKAPARRAAPAVSPPATLPADVTAFKAKRDVCDHFRGEDPYDDARATEIARQIAASCTGTDARLKALRARYRSDKATTAALAGYEDGIE